MDATNGIYFPYPWSQSDSVEIKLPEGFQLDHAEGPESVNFPPVGQYKAQLSFAAPTNTLKYGRSFVFGKNGSLVFDVSVYKTMKTIFDEVHTNDEHLITLKLGDPSAPKPAAVPSAADPQPNPSKEIETYAICL